MKKKEAYALFKKFNFTKTIELLKDVIAKDKEKDYVCFFLLGTSYLHKNNLDLAEKNLKISLELNKKLTDADRQYSLVHKYKEGDPHLGEMLKKVNNKETQVISGPYTTINSLKNDYIKLKSFGFEELDVFINE